MKFKLFAALSWLYTVTCFAGLPTPSIIPQPAQMQVNPGVFTLCPAQSAAGIPMHATTQILADSTSLPTAQYLAALLYRSTGCQFQIATSTATNAVRNAILLTTSNGLASLGAEGYQLNVAPDSVVIRAPAEAGVFYGVQSLLQLLPPQILSKQPVAGVAWVAPCVSIQDQPRFSWRGYMMDESRHFFGKQEVKKFLDALALHKMNIFHWHLTDDEGWRIQILAYPLLTQSGAWRSGKGTAQNNGIDFGQNPRVSSNTNSAGQYGGYYTQDDIREIVAYAQQRHITVVPEIEMPCHCTAALYAYPQFGCGNPQSDYIMDVGNGKNVKYGYDLFSLGTSNTIPFLQEVLTEVMGLFPGPYIHCGGDEVISSGDIQWTTYTNDTAQMTALGIDPSGGDASIIAYENWFSTNLANFLQSNGRTMVGWSEFEAGGIVTNAILEDWETGSSSYAIQAATNGARVVMDPDNYTYLNYYMSTNGSVVGEYPLGEPYFSLSGYLPLSQVYNFEPVPAKLPSQYSSNIIGAEVGEWAEDIPSTQNEEFKAFPRLCAMAEVNWTQAALKNYTNFSQRLATHEQRLTAMGMNYDNQNPIPVANWGSWVPNKYQTNITFDITSYVTNAGNINLDFHYTSGADAINVYSATLFVNGVQVDADNTGYIGYSGYSAANLPYFVLHLKTFIPGATYTVQASYEGYGGTNSSGTVYMVNWN